MSEEKQITPRLDNVNETQSKSVTNSMNDQAERKPWIKPGAWVKSGEPWIWLNAAGVTVCLILVVGLLALITVRGLNHFWPAPVFDATFQAPGSDKTERLIAEIRDVETVATQRLKDAGLPISTEEEFAERLQVKVGNRDVYGFDFRYEVSDWVTERSYPAELTVLEREEWGNAYGYVQSVAENGQTVAEGEAAWSALQERLERVEHIRDQLQDIQKGEIGSINYALERLRLKKRRLELDEVTDPEPYAELERKREQLEADYKLLEADLITLYGEISRDSVSLKIQNGSVLDIPLSKVVRAYRPNSLNLGGKLQFFFAKMWEFVSEDPREANTEGGILPAIFGTVMMVMLMTVLVTPFGVLAALYLREYAKQGLIIRLVRVAVNNLAGVPSIVYGVFGLGFFVYFLGGSIDSLFYQEALPAPTFGTPGILWASLTLALLTLPVVIVSTEEGLARIPRSVREGSLALGATKAETLWRVVIPMASPGMMTGLILAVARAAGEVAPLMLVGVVKLAPSLPLDMNYPFLHLDRKFMHLGFHIYDVGFQSPNVEAARPLVYATALLLVVVIVVLNLFAVSMRNRLREKYRALES